MVSYMTNPGLGFLLSVGIRYAPPIPGVATRTFNPTVDLESTRLHLVLVRDTWTGFGTPNLSLTYTSELGSHALEPTGSAGYTGNNVSWNYAAWDVTILPDKSLIAPRTAPVITTGASFPTSSVLGFLLCSHNSLAANASLVIGAYQFTGGAKSIGSSSRFSLPNIQSLLEAA